MQALHRYKVLQAFTALVSATSIAQILMAVNALVLARHLAPEKYGVYVTAYSAAGLFSFMFNWGLDTWLLRQGAISRDPPSILGKVLAIKGGLGVFWVLIVLNLLPRLGHDIFVRSLLLFCALDVWCEGFFSAELALLNALKRVVASSILLSVSRGMRLFSTVFLIVLGIQSPVVFAQARLGATFLSLAIAIFVQIPSCVGIAPSLLRTFFASMPFALSDLLAAIYLQADVTLLAVLLTNERSVGLYAPAVGLVNALFVIPAAGFTVMVPLLTRLHNDDKHGFVSSVKKMILGYLALGVVLWFGLWVGGRILIEFLLGKAYAISGELLALLSPILFLKSLSFASAAILVAIEWQCHRITVQVLSAFANVSLNLVMISRYGIWGAALVYVVSETILTLGYAWFAFRGLKASGGG